MSDQLIPAEVYPILPPVAVNEDALLRFNDEMDRRLRDFDGRFFKPRQHPRLQDEVRRHREQPPRKPR
jgi:hypothetical protein